MKTFFSSLLVSMDWRCLVCILRSHAVQVNVMKQVENKVYLWVHPESVLLSQTLLLQRETHAQIRPQDLKTIVMMSPHKASTPTKNTVKMSPLAGSGLWSYVCVCVYPPSAASSASSATSSVSVGPKSFQTMNNCVLTKTQSGNFSTTQTHTQNHPCIISSSQLHANSLADTM